jgi:hypothetical protein
MRTSILPLTLAAVFTLAACTGESDDPIVSERAAEPPGEDAPAEAVTPAEALEPARMFEMPASAIVAPELPSPPSPPSAGSSIAAQGWQAWLDAEVARIQAEAPEWFDHVMTLEPKRARSRVMRLVGPALEDPSAAPVLLHRFQTANEPPATKAAVVAALAFTNGSYAAALVDLLQVEPEPLVRVGMIGALQRLGGPEVLAAFELALGDPDAEVRTAAANAIGRHADGASLAAPLIAALDDVGDVQVAAARSLGYLHIEAAIEALSKQLSNADAGVRLSSLQAIDRIDPTRARDLAPPLVDDADPVVAHAAQSITAR